MVPASSAEETVVEGLRGGSSASSFGKYQLFASLGGALAGLGQAPDLRDYDGAPLQIIHRDVSPHNLFVGYDGHVKLVDFGIAKAALSSADQTEAGVLKGKVAYMAPEQALGAAYDSRVDLFAM